MVEEKLLKFIEIDAQYPRKYYKGYVNMSKDYLIIYLFSLYISFIFYKTETLNRGILKQKRSNDLFTAFIKVSSSALDSP